MRIIIGRVGLYFAHSASLWIEDHFAECILPLLMIQSVYSTTQ